MWIITTLFLSNNVNLFFIQPFWSENNPSKKMVTKTTHTNIIVFCFYLANRLCQDKRNSFTFCTTDSDVTEPHKYGQFKTPNIFIFDFCEKKNKKDTQLRSRLPKTRDNNRNDMLLLNPCLWKGMGYQAIQFIPPWFLDSASASSDGKLFDLYGYFCVEKTWVCVVKSKLLIILNWVSFDKIFLNGIQTIYPT